jgi:hypothetical protein
MTGFLWCRTSGSLALLLATYVCFTPGQGGTAGENSKKVSKVTAENYVKLKDGMTEKEVADILGLPSAAREEALGKLGKVKVLTWKNGLDAIDVIINKDGKIAGQKAVFASRYPMAKVTVENFMKIKNGMTAKEVNDILGLPTEEKEVNLPDRFIGKEVMWQAGSSSIHIRYDKDGKVFGQKGSFK